MIDLDQAQATLEAALEHVPPRPEPGRIGQIEAFHTLGAALSELRSLRLQAGGWAAEVERLRAEVARLTRLASGIFAPCRQCGDATTLCAKSMCCVGCNHSVMAPTPTVSEEQLAADLLREVAFINLDTYPSELRDKLADIQRRIAARGTR